MTWCRSGVQCRALCAARLPAWSSWSASSCCRRCTRWEIRFLVFASCLMRAPIFSKSTFLPSMCTNESGLWRWSCSSLDTDRPISGGASPSSSFRRCCGGRCCRNSRTCLRSTCWILCSSERWSSFLAPHLCCKNNDMYMYVLACRRNYTQQHKYIYTHESLGSSTEGAMRTLALQFVLFQYVVAKPAHCKVRSV